MAVEVRRVGRVVGVHLLPAAREQAAVAEDGDDDERDDEEVEEVRQRVLRLPRLRGDDEARRLSGGVALRPLPPDLRGAAVGRVPPRGAPHPGALEAVRQAARLAVLGLDAREAVAAPGVRRSGCRNVPSGDNAGRQEQRGRRAGGRAGQRAEGRGFRGGGQTDGRQRSKRTRNIHTLAQATEGWVSCACVLVGRCVQLLAHNIIPVRDQSWTVRACKDWGAHPTANVLANDAASGRSAQHLVRECRQGTRADLHTAPSADISVEARALSMAK